MTVRPGRPVLEPVISEVKVPAGMLGPDPVTFDVRCFIVPGADGIVLVDAGPPGAANAIEAALDRIGARWSDVSDVVLTHAHFDHVGGLTDAAARTPRANLWAGARDISEIRLDGARLVKPLVDGDRVRGLAVLDTPGHTPGHVSLLDEANSLLLVGDVVGTSDGVLSLGPPAFTADPVRARASLARVASLGVERVVFSHGAEIADPTVAIRHLLGSSQ